MRDAAYTRRPPLDTPLERVLFWVEVVTRPVHDHNRSNDEPVEVEASILYNLLHALDAYDESVALSLRPGGDDEPA